MTFHLDRHSKTDSKPEILSKPEIESNVMKEMCAALGIEKTTFEAFFKTFNKEKIYNCEDRQGSFDSIPDLP